MGTHFLWHSRRAHELHLVKSLGNVASPAGPDGPWWQCPQSGWGVRLTVRGGIQASSWRDDKCGQLSHRQGCECAFSWLFFLFAKHLTALSSSMGYWCYPRGKERGAAKMETCPGTGGHSAGKGKTCKIRRNAKCKIIHWSQMQEKNAK